MEAVCLSSAYLAPIQYYTKLLHFPTIIIEGHCNYLKQTIVIAVISLQLMVY